MSATPTAIPTEAELRDLARLWLEPIDFPALVAAGVLAPAGRGWWRVLDEDRLPPAVTARIGGVADGYRIKLETPTPAQRRQLARIAAG